MRRAHPPAPLPFGYPLQGQVASRSLREEEKIRDLVMQALRARFTKFRYPYIPDEYL